jgi:hypothetical protein
MTGTLHEDQYTFLTIFGSILLRMGNVSDKRFRENHKTNFLFHNFLKNRAVYEIIWANMLELGRTHDNMAHELCKLDT